MDIEKFRKLPIMGILRGVQERSLEGLFSCVCEAGLETVEITMNTPGASGLISKARSIVKGNISIGAGTVLSVDDLKKALNAGAEFIVSPVLIKNVVAECCKKNIPVFPGALTPQEVLTAYEAGASMVKVFPAETFGPAYIKQLKGPLNNIPLMAVGGIKLENIEEYFSSGADAVAFGGSVFKEEWLNREDFGSIEKLVRQYVEKVRSVKDTTRGSV
ncbi:MAG: bifunctional 4-hydroxy-2-oxoglutarate aldolase/2-dehydro-3-deoxy-phosphogluconate aldolase [Candidatus Omnitrophota bacterium]|nr:bifunctional 4-hydroxy-2-oxoglutarate aldolase/2-dehydro-3-deoxy-phosphogluconate aldolase [Candidatus Omnitrophota bacterium]